VSELTLIGLGVVVEVSRAGSFSAAADRLGYTQSAVSRQVAASEKAVGDELFHRGPRGVRPTPAGEALVRRASRVLEEVAAVTQELAGMRDRLAGTVAVGGYPTAMAHLVPRALARLFLAHPALRVRLVESSTPAQLNALRRGRLEVAVLATGQDLPAYDLDGLSLTELHSAGGMGVAVAADHPFAGRDSVSPEELKEQKWVVGNSADGAPEFRAWPGLRDPRIAFAVRSWPSRFGLIAAGLGIAMLPAGAAAAAPRGVCWVPVLGDDAALRPTAWVATAPGPRLEAQAIVQALAREARSHQTEPQTTPAGP